MFHRRLILLGCLLGVGMVAPVLQLSRWTLVKGEELRDEADEYLVSWNWLPTSRGKVLDAKGRILAQDRPSFDVAVDYRVITGQWAVTQSYRRARRLNREAWPKLTRAQRRELAEQCMPDLEARQENMWNEFCRVGGITRAELNERMDEVKKRVQGMASAHRANLLAKLEEKATRAGVEAELADIKQLDNPIYEQQSPHVLLHDVDDLTAFAFIRLTQGVEIDADDAAAPMPGVSVNYTGTREYPYSEQEIVIDRSSFPGPLKSAEPLRIRAEGVGTHVVGWMRNKVYREDNRENDKDLPVFLPDGSRNPALYLDGESIGSAGMERAAERDLRGLRGLRTVKLDTQEKIEVAPQMGKDVQLTIDIELQARIQGLLSPAAKLAVVQPWHSTRHNDEELPNGVPTIGEELAGSVVVIEVDTGNVLAMVSSPSFTRAQLTEDPGSVFRDRVFMPAINRAISQPYAPGSIVKPLVLCEAISQGKYSPTERIACTGHFLPNQPNILRCWMEKQNHSTHSIRYERDLDGSDAIMGSCNIFFFEMGKRLGVQGISDCFRKFGVGPNAQRWELGLGYEYAGELKTEKSGPSDAYQMGIGQGPIAWTPMHAADSYATLGRAGIKIRPRLRADSPTIITDLHLDPAAIDQALKGLERAVTEDVGTAHHITVLSLQGERREDIFNVRSEPGIHIWAKSGTADATALVSETDEQGGKRVLRDGDHAWCVCLCGDESSGSARPKYAIAVVCDYGGSGGRVSGPIANQVVRQLMELGYLKRSASTASREP